MSAHFSLLDWGLIAAFLAGYAYLGVRARSQTTSVDEFLVMGRRLGPWWGVATLAASETGLITLIYFAEEAYLSGFVVFILAAVAALTMFVVGWTGLVIKGLRALEVRTVPEFMERRYNAHVRSLAGLAMFVVGVLNLGIFLQAESAFMAAILGLPEARIAWVMAVMLVVVVAYTMLGGMYSVVLTDVVQFVMIVVGVGVTTYFVVGHAGGWDGLVAAVGRSYGDAGFLPWRAPRFGLLFLTWTTLYYLSGWSTWQPVVARVLSMRDVDLSLRLFRWSSLFMLLRAAFPMLWGLGALAILGPQVTSSLALPNMLVQIIPAGLIGLVTVGFISASMSTYSSYLLAFSSVLLQDVIGPHTRKPWDGRQRILAMRAGTVLIAVFIFAWASFYRFPESLFRFITLSGSLAYAATFSVLLGGIYWKRTNVTGAYCAFVASALPPLAAIVHTSIAPTYAGLLSFVLAPVGLLSGSLWPSTRGHPRP
jgi:SSS family solute:Na+ symporter